MNSLQMGRFRIADAILPRTPHQNPEGQFNNIYRYLLGHNGFGLWVLGSLVAIGLLGCSALGTPNFPGVDDGGFLSGNPCGPPCFWYIIPADTREDQVVQILKSRGVFDQCKSFNNESSSGWRGYFCSTFSINFRRGADVVQGIGFTTSRKITVADVLSHYGNPDTVSVGSIGLPEKPKITMSLYYKQIHTVVGMTPQEGSFFRIKDSTECQGIGYEDDERFEFEMKNAGRSMYWRGYGTYSEGQ